MTTPGIGHNRDWKKIAEEAAEALEGTAGSLHDKEDWAEGQTVMAFCERLDELVFCCDTCGWWCSMDEANDNDSGYNCEDCHNEAS